MSNREWIELTDAMQMLETQLTDAQESGSNGLSRFELGKIEVEFGIDLRTNATGDTGLEFGVLSIDPLGETLPEAAHRIKFTLHPKDPAAQLKGARHRR
ncbi:trypco2 family protein [Antrihabitans cavernicola]|uniref:Trypsin-co-occurring domain-containing protein n=1 Tax=Antrihabitans cavernicola TaxID=2495913 RepID=A0A5A7SEB2_9NOCA|nr:trypco2 family protein [Spelaeibacter cavernicola]KAA0024428.1 hypothetical protein FOY51_00195 [Spelaeibacter cavernicola]